MELAQNGSCRQFTFIICNAIMMLLNIGLSNQYPVRAKLDSVTLPGNYSIGGIFSVRHQLNTVNQSCEIIDVSGLLRMTAMMYAVDVINSHPDIMKGTTLGYVINDDCGVPTVAIAAAMGLLIGPNWNDSQKWVVTKDEQLLYDKTDLLSQSPIIAVIGSSNSDTSSAVAGFLNIASLPQISYGAIGKSLSDKTRYPTFMRTIPSADYQVDAILDLIVHFNWTWVSIVASADEYGRQTSYTFQSIFKASHICTATTQFLSTSISTQEIANIFDNLTTGYNYQNMSYVVILALDNHLTHSFFQRSMALKYEDQLNSKLWIITKAWGDSSISPSFDCLPQGVLGLIPKVPPSTGFQSFLENMTVAQLEQMNKWFKDYFDMLADTELRNRLLGGDDYAMHLMDKVAEIHDLVKQNKDGGNVVISPDWQVALSSVPEVISAVWCLALSLDHMQRTGELTNATEMDLLQHLHSMNFVEYATKFGLEGNEFVSRFNESGDVNVGYWISNLQQIGTDRTFVRILTWDKFVNNNTSTLTPIANASIQWPSAHLKEYGDVTPCSKCGVECEPGTFYVRSSTFCCWNCPKCGKGTYSNTTNASNCSPCPLQMFSNENRTDCYFATDYASWKDPMDIAVLVLNGIGFVATFSVITFFLRYQHTPVFVCSNRILTMILITCLTAVFSLPFFYIAHPTTFVCITQVLIYSTAFSAICGIFLVKTWHVNKIFSFTAANAGGGQFNSTRGRVHRREIWLTGGFTIFPLFILIPIMVGMGTEPAPHVGFCGQTWIIVQYTASAYVILLSAAATYMAFKARDLPENYNEAKYICSTVLCFLLFWTASLLSYYQAYDVVNRTFLLCICVQGGGFSIVVFMFMPKMWIILKHPEQNTIAYVRKMNMLHTWRKQLSGQSTSEGGRRDSAECRCGEGGLHERVLKGFKKRLNFNRDNREKQVMSIDEI